MPEKLYKAEIKNRIVELDGSEYIDCSFTECIMRFYGFQPYAMVDCKFDRCSFELAGPASNTIGYMNAMYKGGGEGGKALILDLIHKITGGEHGATLPEYVATHAAVQPNG